VNATQVHEIGGKDDPSVGPIPGRACLTRVT